MGGASPEPTVVLHIGAMKSGTTYVQGLLANNRKALKQQGWFLPRQPVVSKAVREVMGLTDRGRKALSRTPTWDELTDSARAQQGRGSLISMEFLSYAGPEAARRVLAGLAGTDLRVVLTVRDAARALPSQWQSLSRNGASASWPEFVSEVRSSTPRSKGAAARAFRRTQDLPRMIDVWSALVPPERLRIVTVPPSSADPALLWRRFLAAAEVDPEGTATDGAFDNPRLGYGSCELLRLLNAAGLADERPSAYRKVVRYVARRHLLPLRDQESQPALDEATARFATELNQRTRTAVERDCTLFGDLADLPVIVAEGLRLDPGETPRQVDDGEVLRAATAARVGVLEFFAEHGLALPPGADAPPPETLGDAVAGLAELMRLAMRGSRRP